MTTPPIPTPSTESVEPRATVDAADALNPPSLTGAVVHAMAHPDRPPRLIEQLFGARLRLSAKDRAPAGDEALKPFSDDSDAALPAPKDIPPTTGAA